MATVSVPAPARARAAATFGRHLGEMTLAMLLGMGVYGVVVGALAAAAGSSAEGVRLHHPELFALGMAASMSVPMVAWMRHRGHGRRTCVEMTLAMVLPMLVLVGAYRAGAIAAAAICPVACGAMIPAMAAAMLYRRGDYVRKHAAQGAVAG